MTTTITVITIIATITDAALERAGGIPSTGFCRPLPSRNLKEAALVKYVCILIALCLAPYCFAATPDTPKAAAVTTHEVSMEMVAKIKVGDTTGAQIRELLGTPWRTNNYGDCNVVDYQETWEYLGHDADGQFKINIEFDDTGIARIVAKIPPKGPIVVLAAAPPPKAAHHH
ncbi:MAG TPA: outer membrane protein assembly factor BamE [Bryobacteraceae bacterium]|nr:outer membrane protein assembly factor BamE [Bryobacteraceae bacterium]